MIKLVFYEVFEDKDKNSEELFSIETKDDPTYKRGDPFTLIDSGPNNEVNLKGLANMDRQPTHQIVHVSEPVILFTKDTNTGQKIVTNRIYLYYLLKIPERESEPFF
jgi:hypothetical protein